jgi:hypothetical protein
MCGITGIFKLWGDKEISMDTLKKMIQRILDSLRLSMTFLEFSNLLKNKPVFLVCYC